ncbi:hypothetical protein, partial [Tenacibaculum maritimum]
NDNLIYNIKYRQKSLNIEIKSQSSTSEKCKCYECTLSRNEAHVIKNKCKEEDSKEPKDLLKKAYYYYKIGHLNEALIVTNEILKINKKEYPIISFIAGYNKDLLRGMWFGDENFEVKRGKIKPKNENKILKEGMSSIEGYILYSKYFDYKFFDLIEDYEKVKKRYESHEGMGAYSVSNVDWKNILRWLEIRNIIQKNGIFFDTYSNIKKFAKYTLKISLLASEDREVKIKIHDYILITTMPYLSIEDYNNCFHNLKISKLNYSYESNKKLFEFYVDKIKSLNSTVKFGEKHSYLDEHLKDIEKIIFIQSHLSFSRKQDNIIISTVLSLIESNDFLEKKMLPFLKPLVSNKGECFNKRNA